MKQKRTIEFKIMVPFLLLVLIPCLAVGITAYWTEFQSYKNERLKEAENRMSAVISYLTVLEQRSTIGELSEEEAKEVARHLMLQGDSIILLENSTSYDKEKLTDDEHPPWWQPYINYPSGKYQRSEGKEGMQEEWVMLYQAPTWEWTIVIPFTLSYFAEPLMVIQKNTILVMIIAAIIAVQLTIMLSHHLSRPLKTLAAFCQEQGKGDRSDEIEVFLSRNDEIGVLTHSVKGMLINIEEKKQLEKKMEKIERLASMGEMASGIAHEIRNPLAGIKTTTQVLASRLQLDDRNQVLFQGVVREIDRMNRIITNLLNLAGPREPQTKRIVVYEVVEQIFILLEKENKDKNIKFYNLISKELNYMVDQDHFKQIIINLSLNAVNAMVNGGKVVFTTGDNGELAITDNGKGIPNENLGKIFDPFYSTSSKGTGIGLSIVHQLVLQNNGEIEVESELDKGTTFTLHFPVVEGGISLGESTNFNSR